MRMSSGFGEFSPPGGLAAARILPVVAALLLAPAAATAGENPRGGCPPTLELWSATALPGGGGEVDLLRVRGGLGRFDRIALFVDAPPPDPRDRWFVPELADAARGYRVERRTRTLDAEALAPFCEAIGDAGLTDLTPAPGCERLESMAATVLPTLRRIDLDDDRGFGYRATRIVASAMPDCAHELGRAAGGDGRRVNGSAIVRKEVEPDIAPERRTRLTRTLEAQLRDAAAGWLDGAATSDGPVAASLLPAVREALGEKATVRLGFAEPPDFRLGLDGSPPWLKVARAAEALSGGGAGRDAALVTVSRIPAPDLAFELHAAWQRAAARGESARAVTALRALLLADPVAARAEARPILDAGDGPLTDAALGVFVFTDARLEARWGDGGPPDEESARQALIEAARAADSED